MREIEVWLDEELAPRSRIAARIGCMPRFRRGEEREAQASVDLLLQADLWDEVRDARARATLAKLPDVGETMLAAEADRVDIVDLARLHQFLAFYVAECSAYLSVSVAAGIPTLDTSRVGALRELFDAIDPGATAAGFVLPSEGESEIGVAQGQLELAQSRFLAWSTQRLAELRALGIAAAHQPEFVVLRAAIERLDAPDVAARVRIVRELPGFVVCGLRYDTEALAELTAIEAAQTKVADCETLALARFAERIRRAGAALAAACDWVAALDVLLARRAFVVRRGLQRVEITEENVFACEAAIYLPLALEIGSRYTPLDLQFQTSAVLSGANMGGKTSALQTAALLVACVQRGLPVPARAARLRLYDGSLWFGEAAQIFEGRLSAFGLEMQALRDLLAQVDANGIVFLDEIGRTTTPREGRALCIAVLRHLIAVGATVVIATHFDGVASELGARHFRVRGIVRDIVAEPDASPQLLLRSLEDAFDRRFVVYEEEASRSQAFTVAKALGIPESILIDAERAFACSRNL